MFQEMISQCAANFGAPPRRVSLWDRLTYLRVARPGWLYQSPDDALETLFLNLPKLRREGKVVWGHFVQANYLLYAPGDQDCPAEVVYSLRDTDPIRTDALTAIAAGLGALKSTKPTDPRLRVIADHLTNEMTRVFGVPVPPSISPRYECLISTTYVVRKHLPPAKPWIASRLLPLIVLPTEPHVALPLPSRYWPDSLIVWWCSMH